MSTRWWNPLSWWESRQLPGDSGLNAYLNDLSNYVSASNDANPHATAAVEFALNEIGRAFWAAEVTPALPGLGPSTLAFLARQTIATGNCVMEIDVTPSGIRLFPVAQYSVRGGRRPESWRYSFKQQQPNGDDPLDLDNLPAYNVPAEGMVHVRYMPSPSAPWSGRSPLSGASLTADQLAKIERSLAYDATPIGGLIMPMPHGATQKMADEAGTKIANNKGLISLLETMGVAFGTAGAAQQPRNEWQQQRFGAEVPQANIDLRDKSAQQVMAATWGPSVCVLWRRQRTS